MPEIKAILIFEMLGRPIEHVKYAIEQFIEKLSKEEGIEIINKKIHEPKKLEQTKQEQSELFTTFSEIEIKFKNLQTLLKIIFWYMPSHIEILEPEEIALKNFEFGGLITEIVRRLHQYDELIKRVAVERNILQNQLQQQGIKPAIPLPNQPEQKQQPEQQTKKQESKKKTKTRKGKKKR